MAEVRVGMARPAVDVVPGDLALVRAIWLLLLAQFLSILPLTASNIFIPSMATDLDSSVAVLGGLRSLGGIAALACGALLAPLIDRVARAWIIAGGLVVLALASVLAAQASLVMLIAFYLLSGAAGAVLMPALQSASADGVDAATGARAAAMMSAMGGIAAMVAAPLLAAPSAWWGWRGDFLAIAVVILLLAILAGTTLGQQPPTDVVRTGYLAALRMVGTAPGALALLLGSTLRATLWLGWIAYLPAYYAEQFAAPSATVAIVWSLGGTAYFVANVVTGRIIGAAVVRGWRTPERLLPLCLLATIVLAPLSLLMPTLPPALLATTLFAGVNGAALAGTVSLLIRRYTPLRGSVMSLNAAGNNLGLFIGALVGGVALGLGGYAGLAVGLALLAGVAAAVTLWAVRRPGVAAA